jgi:hypothetical protein
MVTALSRAFISPQPRLKQPVSCVQPPNAIFISYMSPGKFIICYVCLCYKFPSLELCHCFTYSLLFISYFLCRVLWSFCVLLYLDFSLIFSFLSFFLFTSLTKYFFFFPSALWFFQFSFINSEFLIFYLPSLSSPTLFVPYSSIYLFKSPFSHTFFLLTSSFSYLLFIYLPNFPFHFPIILPCKQTQKMCKRIIIAIA